uniref:BTB domain-containing protein n=1 Tax=Panagrolaimus superbus TaxID=310955 RepID=A0A914Z1M9_9BILA
MDEPSTITLAAFLEKCNPHGREFIKFYFGASLEIVYPITTCSTTTLVNEKCEGEYQIQHLSNNIKNLNVQCTYFCNLHFTRDMTFTLTDECAKHHATQITIEVDVGKEVVVPYFLRLDRTLLNHLEEGEGDSHIIKLPQFEFLTFKCTILKILDKFELYIENIDFPVKINGSKRSYWVQLGNMNDDSSDFIEKLNFSFNPDIVQQQFNVRMSENRDASQSFGPSSRNPTAPTEVTDVGEEDVQFYDANCNERLNLESENPSEPKKDENVMSNDCSNVCGDIVEMSAAEKADDEKLNDKYQILNIYDKEKKQKDVDAEVKPRVITMDNLRKALDEIQMNTTLQESTTVPSTKDDTILTNIDHVQKPTSPQNPPKPVPRESFFETSTSPSSSNITTPTKKTDLSKTPITKITKSSQSDKNLSQLLSSLEQKQKFYNKILNQTKYTDVILVNQNGEEVNAFRCFLANSSPVFEAIFDSKIELPCRIEVGAFECETIKQAVYFSQGDLITVNGNVMDLFKFAKTFAMKILMVCKFFCKFFSLKL